MKEEDGEEGKQEARMAGTGAGSEGVTGLITKGLVGHNNLESKFARYFISKRVYSGIAQRIGIQVVPLLRQSIHNPGNTAGSCFYREKEWAGLF